MRLQNIAGFTVVLVLLCSCMPKASLGVLQTKQKQWGAFIPPNESREQFVRKTGAKPNLWVRFVGWNDPFPHDLTPDEQWLIFWEQTDGLDTVTNGESDAYIDRFAASAAKLNDQLIIAPLHEMNGKWTIYGGYQNGDKGGGPEKVINAWQYLHGRIRKIAKQARFAWAVNAVSVPDEPWNVAAKYYPGDAFVDLIGFDGFNRDDADGWVTWDRIMPGALSRVKKATKVKKDIWIFSMGCAQGPQKGPWITQALALIQTNPDITGFVWFNERKQEWDGLKDWRVESAADSLTAFRQALAKLLKGKGNF